MLVSDYFKKLGFNKKEEMIYLLLAEAGKSNAGALARRSRLPRSTVYTILDHLTESKLVSTERSKGLTYYIVNKPNSFLNMVKQEKQRFEEKHAEKHMAAGELVDLLGPYFQSKYYSVPKLQFYEGYTNVRSMLYDNLSAWQQSVNQEQPVWWGYQDRELVLQYSDWIKHHGSLMAKDEKVWLFSNQSEIEKKMKGKIARREIRLVPKGVEFSSTIWVIGDYVITIMTRQKPHYAFQLKDAIFASNQRNIFKMLWDMTSLGTSSSE